MPEFGYRLDTLEYDVQGAYSLPPFLKYSAISAALVSVDLFASCFQTDETRNLSDEKNPS